MSQLSRRRFLEDSMFAATAAIAVGSTNSLMARDEVPAASKSPNERLSVAVIGVNGRGVAHLNAFNSKTSSDTEITYICDADEAVGQRRVAEVAEKQGRAPKYVKDMREIFADPNVDIVSTATPNHWHALCAIWAMQAGKDVYLEKPVSHNVSEGRRIVEAARKYNRICQTGTQIRSTSGTVEAINYLHSGKLGKVTLSRGLCYKPRGSIGERGSYEIPATVDYNLWAGPAPMSPLTRPRFHYDWHWQWDCGNGDLGNQGIHQVDVARWGLGVDQLCNKVFSYGGRVGYTDAGDTANTQVIWCDFGDDKSLVFEVRGLKTDAYRGAKIGNIFYGTEGYLVLAGYSRGAVFSPNGEKIAEFAGGGEESHFQNFIDAVRSRNASELNADIEQGHQSSAICHLGNISYLLGDKVSVAQAKERVQGEQASETYERFAQHLADNNVSPDSQLLWGAQLTLDPKSETFVGNDKANAMLTREYRAPFVVPAAGQV